MVAAFMLKYLTELCRTSKKIPNLSEETKTLNPTRFRVVALSNSKQQKAHIDAVARKAHLCYCFFFTREKY